MRNEVKVILSDPVSGPVFSIQGGKKDLDLLIKIIQEYKWESREFQYLVKQIDCLSRAMYELE